MGNETSSNLYGEIRQRIEREDDLFNARANIFLLINTIIASAVSISFGNNGGHNKNVQIHLIALSSISYIANVLWVMCSYQSLQIFLKLKEEVEKCKSSVENMVQEALGKNKWVRPNAILGIYLPILFTFLWFIAVAYLLFNVHWSFTFVWILFVVMSCYIICKYMDVHIPTYRGDYLKK